MEQALGKIATLSNTHEGRDKFNKSLQYLLKIILATSSNKELKDRITPLFNILRDARKIFRIGKGINEFNFILKELKSYNGSFNQNLNLAIKASYFIYWFFDNISILSKLKVLNYDVQQTTKLGALGWFLGSFLSFVKFIFELNELQLKKTIEDPSKKDPEIETKIFNKYLDIIGKFGDMIPSSQIIELPHKLFGKGWEESHVGYGGFIAGLLAVRTAWKSAK